MQNNDNFNFEATKALIYDDTNVTETNPFIELLKILAKLCSILVCIYFSIYITSGIIINNLGLEEQIKLEKILSSSISEITDVADYQAKERFRKIKTEIINADNSLTDISVGIIKSDENNAFCYPNGKIYITSSLYEKLADDEMLIFVIAHEVAHYKNRDHLMDLRKNIAGASVIILTSIFSGRNSDINGILEGSLNLTALKHSRNAEYKADEYACEILKSIYANVNGGLKTLNLLTDNKSDFIDITLTHPETKKRIKRILNY